MTIPNRTGTVFLKAVFDGSKSHVVAKTSPASIELNATKGSANLVIASRRLVPSIGSLLSQEYLMVF